MLTQLIPWSCNRRTKFKFKNHLFLCNFTRNWEKNDKIIKKKTVVQRRKGFERIFIAYSNLFLHSKITFLNGRIQNRLSCFNASILFVSKSDTYVCRVFSLQIRHLCAMFHGISMLQYFGACDIYYIERKKDKKHQKKRKRDITTD